MAGRSSREQGAEARGAITGPDRKPLSGRLVTLKTVGGAGELRVTSTDERGQYQFRDLPPGSYEVRVEAEGFEPGVKAGIEVKPPFQNVVDIPMRAAGPPVVDAEVAWAEGKLSELGAPPSGGNSGPRSGRGRLTRVLMT